MSVTVTVSKVILEEFPEINYQLYYLASHEEEQEFVYVYTAKGYYRELTDLLDLYQLPYTVYSSHDFSLLHVLILEDDGLAAALKDQLEKWGFMSVELANENFRRSHQKISLAIVDTETIGGLSVWAQARLTRRLLTVPLVLLAAYLKRITWFFRLVVPSSCVLYKPFRATDLRQAIERTLRIALVS